MVFRKHKTAEESYNDDSSLIVDENTSEYYKVYPNLNYKKCYDNSKVLSKNASLTSISKERELIVEKANNNKELCKHDIENMLNILKFSILNEKLDIPLFFIELTVIIQIAENKENEFFELFKATEFNFEQDDKLLKTIRKKYPALYHFFTDTIKKKIEQMTQYSLYIPMNLVDDVNKSETTTQSIDLMEERLLEIFREIEYNMHSSSSIMEKRDKIIEMAETGDSFNTNDYQDMYRILFFYAFERYIDIKMFFILMSFIISKGDKNEEIEFLVYKFIKVFKYEELIQINLILHEYFSERLIKKIDSLTKMNEIKDYSNYTRKAILIGIQHYNHNEDIIVAEKDVGAMEKKLKELGFQVTVLLDCTKKKMVDGVDSFVSGLTERDVSFFYFTGHGSIKKKDGVMRNFLLPSDANGTHNLFSIEKYISKVHDSRSCMDILFLDCCRDIVVHKGMEEYDDNNIYITAKQNMYIAYATSEGESGIVNNGSSVFTRCFLKNIDRNEDIETLMKYTRNDVFIQSWGEQISWDSSCLDGMFYFKSK
jgi:hypothetical protein